MTLLEEAEGALRRHKYADSKRLFLLAIEAGEPPARCLQGLSVSAYHLREYQEAEAHASAAVQADPSLYMPHMVRAYIRGRRGDLLGSLTEVERATQLSPMSPEIHAYGGGVLLALQRLEEAARSLREAARLGADDWVFHTNIGDLRLREGRYGEAARAYQRSFRARPTIKSLLAWLLLLVHRYGLTVAVLYGAATVLVLATHSLALLLATAIPLILGGAVAVVKGHRKGAVFALIGILYVLIFHFTR